MEDVKDFLRENRPMLLIRGGGAILLVWVIFMLYFRLFQLRPFGSEHWLSMGWALVIFIPLGSGLLWLLYWLSSNGSSNSEYGWVYDLAERVYVGFKNWMVVLFFITLIAGAPRMQYYQMRVANGNGLENLTYYEQRSMFRFVQQFFYSAGETSDYVEFVPETVVVPVPTADIDSSGTSDSDSSSSKSSDSDWLKDLLGPAAVIIAIVLATSYFFIIVVACFFCTNFWLVVIPTIAAGMITLGYIDIDDGPRK